jgi:signal transduction histidine kinase
MTTRQTDMVRRVESLEATALQAVVELVDLARVDAGGVPIERREMNIVATFRGTVDDYRASAADKGLRLTIARRAGSARTLNGSATSPSSSGVR